MLQTKNRILWIDIAKAITILLVVFGHTLRGGEVQRMVYGFHVPTFFLLAGMTCKTTDIKKQIGKDTLRIMVPYYIFGLASILIFLVLGKVAAESFALDVNTDLGSNLLELLLANPKGGRMKFNLPLWFLPCLYVTKLMYYGIHKLFRGKQGKILPAGLILAALGFVYTAFRLPSLPFNFSVALKMLVFFAFGQWLFRMIDNGKIRFKGGWLNCIPGVLLLVVACLVGYLAPKVNYSGDTFPHIGAFVITSLTGTVGICFLSVGIGKSRALEFVGKNTLAVLLMHKFPVLLLQTVGPQKDLIARYDTLFGVAACLVAAMSALTLCLAVGWVIRRFLPFLFGDFSCFKWKK
ncbi:MAG: acyltransferase [Oscillospiraceae bacterium]|nr:acyltransferase [Oscillospiraceae bacterium]